jgi:integrase
MSRTSLTTSFEAGYPERFVSEQVGHSHASTTAIYTSVGDDYKNRVLAQVMATMIVDRGGGEEP